MLIIVLNWHTSWCGRAVTFLFYLSYLFSHFVMITSKKTKTRLTTKCLCVCYFFRPLIHTYKGDPTGYLLISDKYCGPWSTCREICCYLRGAAPCQKQATSPLPSGCLAFCARVPRIQTGSHFSWEERLHSIREVIKAIVSGSGWAPTAQSVSSVQRSTYQNSTTAQRTFKLPFNNLAQLLEYFFVTEQPVIVSRSNFRCTLIIMIRRCNTSNVCPHHHFGLQTEELRTPATSQ